MPQPHRNVMHPENPIGAGTRLSRVAVPSGLLFGAAAVVWTITGGLASCDYSARFSLDQIAFQTVQVVSAFPAIIDSQKGTIKRVCGAPLRDDQGELLPGQTEAEPNGMELTVNLVSSDPNARKTKPKCPNERDFGIKEGERIEFQPVSTSKELSTVAPGHFKLELECYEQHAGTQGSGGCAGGGQKSVQQAKVVKFHKEAQRCDEKDPSTWQNVAVIVDHSGSMSGFMAIDQQKCANSTQFAEDLPGTLKPAPDFKECASDPHYMMVEGARQLIDSLNAKDRVIALGFSENQQVYASCTDDVVCLSDDGSGNVVIAEGVPCTGDTDCTSNAKAGANFRCGPRPDQSKATVPNMAAPDQMTFCYNNSAQRKAFNKYGIEALSKYEGNGRSPVYEALQTGYDFLKAFPAGAVDQEKRGNAKHIVLLTDGPDTCTPNDNFTFVQPFKTMATGAICRKECSFTTTDYKKLLNLMAQDNFPIHIHVIQIQSRSHTEPDETLQELACRSEGTYQLISTAAFNRSEPEKWSDSMGRAILKIRYALAGSWRVGFVDNNVKSEPIGQERAMRGRMRFNNSLFQSLEPIYNGTAEFEWRFEELDKERDTRLTFRRGCGADADCDAGAKECAINSCSPGGLCRQAPAPDLLPCGPNGKSVCCKGTCAAKCDGVCK